MVVKYEDIFGGQHPVNKHITTLVDQLVKYVVDHKQLFMIDLNTAMSITKDNPLDVMKGIALRSLQNDDRTIETMRTLDRYYNRVLYHLNKLISNRS